MKITINGTTFNAEECKEVFGYGTRSLKLVISQEEIGYKELKSLLISSDEIDVINETGAQQTYCGYTQSIVITDKNDKFFVELGSVPDHTRAVLELEHKVKEQAESIEALTAQNMELEDCLIEMSERVYA